MTQPSDTNLVVGENQEAGGRWSGWRRECGTDPAGHGRHPGRLHRHRLARRQRFRVAVLASTDPLAVSALGAACRSRLECSTRAGGERPGIPNRCACRPAALHEPPARSGPENGGPAHRAIHNLGGQGTGDCADVTGPQRVSDSKLDTCAATWTRCELRLLKCWTKPFLLDTLNIRSARTKARATGGPAVNHQPPVTLPTQCEAGSGIAEQMSVKVPVGNRIRCIVEHLTDALARDPGVGGPLDLDQRRYAALGRLPGSRQMCAPASRFIPSMNIRAT
jgi:hypothetical protein